jgi:hypothetical protein
MLRAHDLAQTDQVIQDWFARRLPPTTLPAMFCAQHAAGTDMVAKSARTKM